MENTFYIYVLYKDKSNDVIVSMCLYQVKVYGKK